MLSPFAYFCPFRINTLFLIMFLSAMALYLTLSHGFTAQYAPEDGGNFAWWSATLAMRQRQSIVHFVWFLYNLTEPRNGAVYAKPWFSARSKRAWRTVLRRQPI